jgi:hypothetical protein
MRKASRIDRLTESIADTSFINRLHDQLVLPITHQRYSWLLLFLLLLLVVVAQFSQKCGRFCAHFPINLRKEVVVSGRVNERATELQVARGGGSIGSGNCGGVELSSELTNDQSRQVVR